MIRVGNLALIVIGGAAGTALRAGLEAGFGATPGQWPWITLGINVLGSLLLGVLLEALASGDDSGWRRSVRLGIGTGVMGGFTTYSTYAVETVGLVLAGQWLLAIGYALMSVLLGIAAAVAGILMVRWIRDNQRRAA